MNCKQVEKLLLLSDVESLNEKTAKQLSEHIAGCTNCHEIAKQMSSYQEHIRSMQKIQPELGSPEAFTQSILDEVFSDEKSIDRKQTNSLVRHFGQVAATIVLLLISAFYLQQKLSVSNSIATLNAKYSKKQQNTEITSNFNECQAYAEMRLKKLFQSNKELSETFASLNIQAAQHRLKKYSSRICMLTSDDFLSAAPEQQKQIILNLFKSDITPKR